MTDQHKTSTEFWKHKRLGQMTHTEWESLCDGCGRCCLHKLEDDADERMYYTRVACELLDISTCRCKDYANRQKTVPDCIQLSVDQAHFFDWLPDTCAYRLLAEGESLPEWHPLITGDPQSVIDAGVSVRNVAISESEDIDLTEEVIALQPPVYPHDT
ncbi:YcgN family cysteine cluster protein [uncultured Methylophaga sp.]|uniref:YcgN family cysteine cluster protein n=1 Tax=uncultured Methylophaga sp. TaxID=285271 RepID=UPI0026270751|nr:YcgN family cysteine cluster protein [uncultured Methylophaga sp.]